MSSPKRKCPLCGVTVNLRNLTAHLEKVHPNERATIRLDPEERRAIRDAARVPRRMGSRAWSIVAIAVAVALVVGVFAIPSLPPAPGGTIHLEPSEYDFGTIGQSVVSTTFKLHNRGAENLVVSGISTSCMCTTARLDYAGRSSPIFGFHSNPSGWSQSLPPGAEAILAVFYDPTVHPELGHFVRQVYVLSSDPAQRESTVTIHANEV